MFKSTQKKFKHLITRGEGEIRTLDRVNPITVFETAAFNHSATSPYLKISQLNFSKTLIFDEKGYQLVTNLVSIFYSKISSKNIT